MNSISEDLRHEGGQLPVGDPAEEQTLWTRGRRRRRRRRAMTSLAVCAVAAGAVAAPVLLGGPDVPTVEIAGPPGTADEGAPSDTTGMVGESSPTDALAGLELGGTAEEYRRMLHLGATAKPYAVWEVERYRSLAEMVTWSSAAVVGRIASTAPPYVFQSEENEVDTFTLPRFNIAVDLVLAGDLDPRWGTDEITLVWMGADVADEDLPDYPAVWFLRDYEDPHGPDLANERGVHLDELGSYRTVSSQGLYIGTPEGDVVAPAVEHEPTDQLSGGGSVPTADQTDDPVLREIRRRGLSMAELVAVIAELGDTRVEPWD